MKMTQMVLVPLVAMTVASAHAAETQCGDACQAKLEDQSVLDVARRHRSQDLIIDIDTGTYEADIAAKRTQVLLNAERQRAAAATRDDARAIDTDAARQDALLKQTLKSQLRAYKDAVMGGGQVGRSILFHDFPFLSEFVARVPSSEDLMAILANPAVVGVHPIKAIHPVANWPTSYSDISIIGSNISTGSGGHTGSGVRVAILDTAVDFPAVAGFNGAAAGACGSGMWQTDVYGDVMWGILDDNTLPSSAAAESEPVGRCRIWSDELVAYSTNDLRDPPFVDCADPFYANGSGIPECINDNWKHGTAVANTVAMTAPGAYLDLYQVYDDKGVGTTQYLLDAISFAISNRVPSSGSPRPPLVALNISSETTGSKYTAVCTQSAFYKPFSTLLANNIVPVVASGNSGYTNGVSEPGCVAGGITVGATTDSSTSPLSYGLTSGGSCSDPALAANQVPCFSNTHPTMVTMLAPGVQIGQTTPVIAGNAATTLVMSGTSLAAPHVAGAVAILKAPDLFPSMAASQVISVLSKNGDPVTDRRATTIIKNRLNITKAINSQQTGTPSPPNCKLNPALCS
jgi:hypothetical protein